MAEYTPGVCNIGRSERRTRRLTGLLGLAGGVAVVAAVSVGSFPRVAALAAFPFLLGGFLGILQDRLRFCVAFGALARYQLSDGGPERVTDADAVRRDRRRAAQILGYATALAAVTTGLIYLVVGL
jgi:hypothetical protein